MNPQPKEGSSVIQHALILMVIAISCALLMETIMAVTPLPQQRSTTRTINGKPLAEKEDRTERMMFSENGPHGQWSASFVPDKTRNATTSPVVVVGNSTLMGNAQVRNLQLTNVTLRNYSAKTVFRRSTQMVHYDEIRSVEDPAAARVHWTV